MMSLKDIKEAKSFFRDLLTEDEIMEFGRRWRAAQMLDEGIPYSAIVKSTGLSSTTVARISKWLKKGKGGYRLMIDRLNHQHDRPSSGKRLC